MKRRRWTSLRRAALFVDHDGQCHICGLKIDAVREGFDVDHIIPLALGGEDDEANCRPAHTRCHRGAGGKTADDLAQIAKAKRVRARHLGAREPSRMPGAKSSRWKKKLDGTVVLREPKEDCP